MKKNLTKIIMAAAACLVLTAGTTKAQNGRFSVGAELALPMGDFGDGYGIGFGGTVRYEHPIGDMMGIGLTAGYMTFSGKSVDDGLGGSVDNPNFNMIPAQAFFKYYFQEQQNGFYGMINLGIHHSSIKTPEFEILGVTYGGETVSSTDLSYAPEIGYHLANLDLGLRYQIIATEGSSTSYLGARVAYVFGEK